MEHEIDKNNMFMSDVITFQFLMYLCKTVQGTILRIADKYDISKDEAKQYFVESLRDSSLLDEHTIKALVNFAAPDSMEATKNQAESHADGRVRGVGASTMGAPALVRPSLWTLLKGWWDGRRHREGTSRL